MKPATLMVCLLVFASIFGLHVGWKARQEGRVAAQWVAVPSSARPSAWARYVERQDYWLGYSYALAAAFTAFALARTLEQRRREARGVLGGVTLIGAVYGAGCYFIGCCGSPMLGVYLSLFGTSLLGALKPIVAGVTTLSVVLSGFYIVWRSQRACCPPAKACHQDVGPGAPLAQPPAR
jgi:hypothetical protein